MSPLIGLTLPSGVYTGIVAKRRSDLEPRITLAPGASLSARVRLQDHWFLETSSRRKSKNTSASLSFSGMLGGHAINSNQVHFRTDMSSSVMHAGPSAASKSTGVSMKAGASMMFQNCTDEEESTITDAVAMARTAVVRSLQCLKDSSCTNYTDWFGSKPNAEHYERVSKTYSQVEKGLKSNWIAKCNADQCDPNTYAYVYPGDRSRTIHLCNVFLHRSTGNELELTNTPIHEMSHFSNVGGTDDWAYGPGGCQRLARDDPEQAVDNADNYGYFVSSTKA